MNSLIVVASLVFGCTGLTVGYYGVRAGAMAARPNTVARTYLGLGFKLIWAWWLAIDGVAMGVLAAWWLQLPAWAVGVLLGVSGATLVGTGLMQVTQFSRHYALALVDAAARRAAVRRRPR